MACREVPLFPGRPFPGSHCERGDIFLWDPLGCKRQKARLEVTGVGRLVLSPNGSQRRGKAWAPRHARPPPRSGHRRGRCAVPGVSSIRQQGRRGPLLRDNPESSPKTALFPLAETAPYAHGCRSVTGDGTRTKATAVDLGDPVAFGAGHGPCRCALGHGHFSLWHRTAPPHSSSTLWLSAGGLHLLA